LQYAFGPYVVDSGNRRLLRDGEPVAITARVFDILVALIREAGQPLDKDTLIARVWGDVAVEEGNLARHVSTLRKVLGESPDDRRYIATLPGRGYQFIAPVTALQGEDATPTPTRSSATPTRWKLASIAALIVGVAAALVIARTGVVGRTPAEPPRIVVRPFKNLGPAADEYLAAGITEEITSRLSGVRALRVASRTQNADYALEGAVLWNRPSAGSERVRITAQLIRADDGTHAWAETFDRDVSDLFAVQSEIAVRVVRELRSTVLAAERTEIESPPTRSIDAYKAYLQGLFYSSRPDLSDEGTMVWLRHFQRASELDANFAQAHAALASAHLTYYQFGYDRSHDRIEMARAALDRARSVGPQLPETSRAEIQYWLTVRPDRQAALDAVAALQSQRPDDPRLLTGVAAVFLRLGRWDTAARTLEHARDLDPRDAGTYAQLGLVLTGLRRYSEALEAISQSVAIERDQQLAYIDRVWTTWLARGDVNAARSLVDQLPEPDDWRFMELRFLQALYERRFDRAVEATRPWNGKWMRTWVLVRPAVLLEAQAARLAGDEPRARDAFQSAASLLESEVRAVPDDGRLRSSLAIAYAGLGKRDDALREARRALELMPFPLGFDTSVVREDVALVAAMTGEHEMALQEISMLLSTPAHFSVNSLRLDPRWDPLRQEPRFQALIAGS
jgi:DNA-binding winged helix-turn-helix (wHTH) protein/TolB-like protein/tetratricopeptide (TPR) repeat protein